MLQKTYKFFNQSTRQALFERVRGYVTKSYSKGEEIYQVIKEHKLSKIYRFDLGENVIGFSPLVYQFLHRLRNIQEEDMQLNNYPEVIHGRIRKRIADNHGIDPDWVVISTGLDAILDLITRVFFDPKDYYLGLVPSFYLFEDYSERMGAIPIFIDLSEQDDFALTQAKVDELKEQIIKFKPKIVWIANPNNPTGSVIDKKILENIVKLAGEHSSFVVIDEAYIEYLQNFEKNSMIKLTKKYENMMVLRTFSKAYGLAGMRIGYMISSSKDILEAMLMLRTHFPVTQLALNMASLALSDKEFLDYTQRTTKRVIGELFTKLGELDSFKVIPTNTNIFLLKNKILSFRELDQEFKKNGIIASYVNCPKKSENQYLRITVRNEKDNDYFFKVCRKIDAKFTTSASSAPDAKMEKQV